MAPINDAGVHLSHPARGAWIEIDGQRKRQRRICGSHPARGAWIEIVATSS